MSPEKTPTRIGFAAPVPQGDFRWARISAPAALIFP